MFARLAVGARCCLMTGVENGQKQLLCRVGKNQITLLRRELKQQSGPNIPNVTKTMLSVWNKLFGKYLLITNIISSGVLMVIGDLAAQEIEMRRHSQQVEKQAMDYDRICRMFVVGAAMGPLHHFVYKWMDRVMPVATVRNTLRKILIDQLVMSPACILLFFYSACFLEHKSLSETNEELINKFPYIYLGDWLFWPGAQYVNFRYLPTKYRVTYVNVCTALYNIFLSYIKHDFNLDDVI